MLKKYVVKKDGTVEKFDSNKIWNAIKLSSSRVLVNLSEEELRNIVTLSVENLENLDGDSVRVTEVHKAVEKALEVHSQEVGKSYKDYRNYKTSFVEILDSVFKRIQHILYVGDRENANFESSLISTKGSLIKGELLKEVYQKFFMDLDIKQACKDGYLYVHDMRDLALNSINCCLFDVANVLKGGFEMGAMKYSEPKRIDSALDVFGDIILASTSQQYGGWTAPEVDTVFAPYLEKSYKAYLKKYGERYEMFKHVCNAEILEEKVEKEAWDDAYDDLKQGLQGIEVKLSSVMSAKGDVPFSTFSFGLGTDRFSKAISRAMLEVRSQGHNGVPVVFPKLVFLYDENLHDKGKELEDLFDMAIATHAKSLYPDFLSLTGDGYVADIYKKYGLAISPMGCRAFLSPFYPERSDTPVFLGRANIGAVSLNLPSIYQKSVEEGTQFYDELDAMLQLARKQHLNRFRALSKTKASTNPLGFTQGGFHGGNLKPDDTIGEVIKSFTASFGITALNELTQLATGQSLAESNGFAMEVMAHISKRVDEFKAEDGYLYALYATPAESLCSTQVQQFRAKYGIIRNVSDREFFTNSFHCHVSEDITPVEKQDKEYDLFHSMNGGHIQYVRLYDPKNLEAIKAIVKRGMKMGFYQGVNLSLDFCECGHSGVDFENETCPVCGSRNITIIERVCGYIGYRKIGGTTRFNDGKIAEVESRKCM